MAPASGRTRICEPIKYRAQITIDFRAHAHCKTLVAPRLKLSGMRWSANGAQAILTFRRWDQSECFDEAWTLVEATYQRALANIVDITRRAPKAPRKTRKHPASE